MRPQVAARWAQLLPPGGYLAGFFYVDRTVKGPPFGIERSELETLLAPYFDCVEEADVSDSIPIFVGRERWMVWQRQKKSPHARAS